ncbi:MAG: flippase-like domain-containing protein [Anaerolineae bacterium]|nr:flippase-like domain-containing protein [Anaerolineae bacterium]
MSTPGRARSPVAWRQWLLAAIISVVLVGLLLTQVEDWRDTIEALQQIRPVALGLALLGYVALSLIRSGRFLLLLPRRSAPFGALWHITCMHTLANYILPARTGELTYIALLRARGVSVADGLASLALARLLDLAALAVLVLGAVALAAERQMYFGALRWFALALGVILLLVLFWADRLAGVMVRALAWAAGRLGVRQWGVVHRGLAGAERTAGALGAFAHSRELYAITLALSLLQWAVNFAVYYALLNGLGLGLDLSGTVIASSIASLVAVLPVQGLIGFGTYEAGWTVGLVPLGVARSTAIATGFSIHILMLLLSVLLVGLSLCSAWLIRLGAARGGV